MHLSRRESLRGFDGCPTDAFGVRGWGGEHASGGRGREDDAGASMQAAAAASRLSRLSLGWRRWMRTISGTRGRGSGRPMSPGRSSMAWMANPCSSGPRVSRRGKSAAAEPGARATTGGADRQRPRPHQDTSPAVGLHPLRQRAHRRRTASRRGLRGPGTGRWSGGRSRCTVEEGVDGSVERTAQAGLVGQALEHPGRDRAGQVGSAPVPRRRSQRGRRTGSTGSDGGRRSLRRRPWHPDESPARRPAGAVHSRRWSPRAARRGDLTRHSSPLPAEPGPRRPRWGGQVASISVRTRPHKPHRKRTQGPSIRPRRRAIMRAKDLGRTDLG